MYKFLIPLFALAFLLVSCTPSTPPADPGQQNGEGSVSSASSLDAALFQFDGTILSGKHTVVLKTSQGDITLELDADAAPKTVTNFITLAKNGFYDNLTFHRVIPDFMIQGGDPNGNGSGGRSIFGEKFEDEINANSYGLDKRKVKDAVDDPTLDPAIADLTLKQLYEQKGYVYNDKLTSIPLVRGSIAMANAGPNTNGSQFFIVHAAETPWLNGQHTVFGKVTKGMDVVDAITAVPRDGSDAPLEPVTFTVEVSGAASSPAASAAPAL
ncbi:MAG: peptidylprolyl isomerase [Candidatus Peribacteraceae bacterium]|jgi:cyclophilin family peptidyl-prolyl cis-trans isomerase